MRLQPGTFLQGDKYRIIDVLGQGGFGITYLAEQVMAERKVCIKEFFPKEYYNRDEDSRSISLGSQGSAEIMDLYKAKFIKEAKTIAKLDHPNIIHIFDVFAENNTAYYVMEYIDGESLSALVKERGALSESEAVGYIKQVAAALGNIHEQRIMHLDIKPANIMLRKADGKPVLIDFGLSKQYDAEGNQTSSTPVGISAGYAPMEQYQQGGVKEFSPETDIYSLGATLYYLVTGCVPPQAAAIVDDGLPELPAHLSANVRNAIERSMEIQRKRRPHSMDEFVALLGDGNTAPTAPVVNNVAAAAAPSVEDESTRFGAPLNDESTKFAEAPKAEPKRAEAPKKEWTPKYSTEKPKKSDDNKKKSRWWMWLLGLLLIGGGAYFLLVANNGKNTENTKNIEEDKIAAQVTEILEKMYQAAINKDFDAFVKYEDERMQLFANGASDDINPYDEAWFKWVRENPNKNQVIDEFCNEFETLNFIESTTTEYINGHEVVDMGVSVKWATCNEGATSPEHYGHYYLYNEALEQLHKSGYRLPTQEEFEELINNSFWYWTYYRGTYGIRFTNKINGNSIFLPAGGYFETDTIFKDKDKDGFYWSCTSDGYGSAYYLRFNDHSCATTSYDDNFRQSVRLVAE